VVELVPAIHVSAACAFFGPTSSLAWATESTGLDVSSSKVQRFAMSGSALSSAALDERRRRILFRAWRRGVREMDLIMGRFADAHLPTMNDDELAEFERLLDVPDPEALAWIVGGERPPREFDTPLFARLCGSR
jgi:antitoxin CptB